MSLHKTDIVIIGAGPVGLFTVFEAGLLGLKCHLIDALPRPGGQLTELYPKKPIYDIPGFPSVLAGDLVDNLMEQIKQFEPEFTLGEIAETLDDLMLCTGVEDEIKAGYKFSIWTKEGTNVLCKAVIIAGGLGIFSPRRPDNLPNLRWYEDRGVSYFIKDPEIYRDRRVVIAGGGDSALDWTIYLSNIAKEVTLVHRSEEFRGALDSLEKVGHLRDQGKVDLITNAQITELKGETLLQQVKISGKEDSFHYRDCDYFIPLFGLVPKLGPIGDWRLDIEKNALKVNTTYYSTNVEGIYAVGDVNTYEGKLKLILCGFHEATLAVQGIYNSLNPGKKFLLKYTTVSGVDGFDGTRKEAEKPVTKKI